MRTRGKVLTSFACAGALVAAPLAGAPAQAVTTTVSTDVTWTVADGIACAGWVRVLATTRTEQPGKVTFQITGGFFGISGTPYPCQVEVHLPWANAAAKKAGVVRGIVAGTLIPSVPTRIVSQTADTGSGTVDFSLTTSRPYIAQSHATITAS